MKNNYSSHGNSNKTATSIKRFLVITILLVSACFNTAFGAVTITAPSLTITTCSFPSIPSAIGNIVITEGLVGDISTFGTLILTAPTNFEFMAAGSASFTGTNITSVSVALTNANTITLTINGSGTNIIDAITMTGITVRAIAASAASNIRRTDGTSVIAGNANGAVLGTLTSVLNSVTGGTITSAQTICSGGDPAAFTQSAAPTGFGTLTYAWKLSTDGYSNTIETTMMYDVPPGLTDTTTYRRITTSLLNGVTCIANSNEIIVTVQAVPTGGTIASAQTICSGGDPAAFTQSAASTGSGTPLTYAWKSSADGFGVATLASIITHDVPLGLAVTTTYRRVTTSTVGSSTCTANSNDIIVTVLSAFTGGTIASAQTICSGGDPAAFTESVASTGSGALSYQWKKINNSTILDTNLIYDVPAGLTTTTTYRRITTSTLAGVTCTANSNDIVVTINAVTPGSPISAQTICSGGDPAAFTQSGPATGSGTLSYEWKQSTDGYGVTLATTAMYDVPSGLTATTTYRRITTSLLNGVTCTANNNIVVTINAVTAGDIAAAQTICNGGDPAIFTEGNFVATGSGTLTYLWKHSTDSYSDTLATSATYNVPSGLVVTTTYRRITISTLGGITCTANSVDILVTVQSAVTGGIFAAAQTICSGGDPAAFTESTAATGSGTLTYEWKHSTDSYSNTLATTATYDIPTGLTATTTYRRITTSTVNGVACTANSNDIIVTINAVTAGTIASAQTICSGGDPAAFTESPASTGSGTLTYLWKHSTDSYSDTLATTETYDVPSGLAVTTTYRQITLSTLGGHVCAANSNNIPITVNQLPVVTNSTEDTICSGVALSILLTSDTPSSFTWIATDNPNTNGESTTTQPTSTLSDSITNNTTAVQTVTYTVTPTSITGSCVGTVQTVTATVNPLPTVSSSGLESSYCFNASAQTLTGSPVGGEFTGSGIVVNTSTFSASLAGSGTPTITYTYTDVNGCANTSNQNTIVLPLPIAPSICMVTVDELSENNIIYWDKTSYTNVDTFIVYRDTANNNYAPIGKVLYDSLSQFIDTDRTIYASNGDPNATSWRYKLGTIDSCGNISPLSKFHQTIFIQHDNSGNFSWNQYQIESQVVPVPPLLNYLFLRDDLSNGNYIPIQSLSASSTAYTDQQYATYQTTATWRIETVWSISCDPTRVLNTSRSNIKRPGIITGILPIEGINFSMEIYPNPAKDNVTIEISSLTKNAQLKIINVLGQAVFNETIIASPGKKVKQINTSNFAKGVYTVEIETNSTKVLKKLVVN